MQLSRLFALTNQARTGNCHRNRRLQRAHRRAILSEADFSDYQITFDGKGKDVVINGRRPARLHWSAELRTNNSTSR